MQSLRSCSVLHVWKDMQCVCVCWVGVEETGRETEIVEVRGDRDTQCHSRVCLPLGASVLALGSLEGGMAPSALGRSV